jgi:predicted DNA-binding transcriptional regulator YafY
MDQSWDYGPRRLGQLRSSMRDKIREVTDTAGRLLHLLALLQRRPSWSGLELADRLGVDTRTVRRDVERVRNLGYRVDSTPGTGGGYRLGVSTDMPPLLLDEDEAMAVAVLLGVSAGVAVPGIERATLATLARVDRLLPPRLQRQVKALRAATVPLMGPVDTVPSAQLASLAQACEGHELVSFGYSSREGKATTRRVEPHRLVVTDRRWYLVAYDLDRRDWRTFRVDRTRSVRLTGHTFVPRPLADPGRLVSEGISAAGYHYRAVVRFAVPADQVSKRVPPHVGSVQGDGGGSTILKIGVDDSIWLTGYLIGLGFPFEVVDPPELRDGVLAIAEQVARAHSLSSSPAP